MIIYVVEEIDGEKMVHIETEAFYNDGRGEFSCIDYTWCYVPINDLNNYMDYTCEVQQYQGDYKTAEELLAELGELNQKELELEDVTEDTPLGIYRTKIDPDLVIDKEKSR